MNVLETKRLNLRLLKTSDCDSLYRILSDSEVMRYYPQPLDRVRTEEWIARSQTNYKKYGHGFYACMHKESREFVGICGLVPQSNMEGTDRVEVGYLFNKRYWNQGLATEASFGCLDYGFTHFHFDQLVSLIDPKNLPSIRVAEKNGLTFEKTTWRFNKTMHIYSITKEVWEANAYSRAG